MDALGMCEWVFTVMALLLFFASQFSYRLGRYRETFLIGAVVIIFEVFNLLLLENPEVHRSEYLRQIQNLMFVANTVILILHGGVMLATLGKRRATNRPKRKPPS